MHAQPGRKHTETIDYIQSMLGELHSMAEAEHCDMLAYLIEMSYLEASDILRGQRPPRTEQKRNSSA